MAKSPDSPARRHMEIVQKKIVDLLPYVRNARVHDETQINSLARSIKEFGFNSPILLDGQNGVIAGHGRLMAARKLGLTEVPCIELAHLTEKQKKAYIIADNAIATQSGWDNGLLKRELDELLEQDFDVSLTGLSAKELGKLMDDTARAVKGKAPDADQSFGIYVECKTEKQQQKTFKQLEEQGIKCKLMN